MNIHLFSSCPRALWIFHSLTWPGKEAYARKWGHQAAFYVHPENMAQTWDRLRVWQEALAAMPEGDWLWHLGPGCFIATPDVDIRSLGPFSGDMVVGGDGGGFGLDSFLLRNTPETRLFLERAAKLRSLLGSEEEALVILLTAELIRLEVRPRRQFASLYDPTSPAPPETAYQPGDLVAQIPGWHASHLLLLQKLTAPARKAAPPQQGPEHCTYCVQALGDNMAHVHFLRKLAQRHPERRFVHQAQAHYLPQLQEMAEDLPNLSLEPMRRVEAGAVDGWKNTERHWETHPLRDQYAAFFIDFFRHLAGRMGLESPIEKPEDLLFDYPALQKPTPLDAPFDFLVVNSTPLSGQLSDASGMDALIAELAARYKVVVTQPTPVPGVVCTQDHGLSVSGIGRLSTLCKHIVMISTGSSWGTFNVWNIDSIAFRVILIDREQIGLSKNTVQAATISAARLLLQEKGLL